MDQLVCLVAPAHLRKGAVMLKHLAIQLVILSLAFPAEAKTEKVKSHAGKNREHTQKRKEPKHPNSKGQHQTVLGSWRLGESAFPSEKK